MTIRTRFELVIDSATDAFQADPDELAHVVKELGLYLESFNNREPGVIEIPVLDSFNELVGTATLRTDKEG